MYIKKPIEASWWWSGMVGMAYQLLCRLFSPERRTRAIELVEGESPFLRYIIIYTYLKWNAERGKPEQMAYESRSTLSQRTRTQGFVCKIACGSWKPGEYLPPTFELFYVVLQRPFCLFFAEENTTSVSRCMHMMRAPHFSSSFLA